MPICGSLIDCCARGACGWSQASWWSGNWRVLGNELRGYAESTVAILPCLAAFFLNSWILPSCFEGWCEIGWDCLCVERKGLCCARDSWDHYVFGQRWQISDSWGHSNACQSHHQRLSPLDLCRDLLTGGFGLSASRDYLVRCTRMWSVAWKGGTFLWLQHPTSSGFQVYVYTKCQARLGLGRTLA